MYQAGEVKLKKMNNPSMYARLFEYCQIRVPSLTKHFRSQFRAFIWSLNVGFCTSLLSRGKTTWKADNFSNEHKKKKNILQTDFWINKPY